MAHEFQAMTRIIPLDNRYHCEGLEAVSYGNPAGHWESSALLIDTTNFKRWMLDDYFQTNPKEYRMHSGALHTTESISCKDATTFSYKLTIDDPKIFAHPRSQCK